MFNPSQEDVRRFFCAVYDKMQANGAVLTPLEHIAADWIGQHPEYHQDFAHLDQALTQDYRVADGQTNPFLHLSMHLTITEQVSIDQPAGIRDLCQQLSIQTGSIHAAHHHIMDCLGQMLWQAQRDQQPPDVTLYLACIKKRVCQ